MYSITQLIDLKIKNCYLLVYKTTNELIIATI